jgi:hypothetical protein
MPVTTGTATADAATDPAAGADTASKRYCLGPGRDGGFDAEGRYAAHCRLGRVDASGGSEPLDRHIAATKTAKVERCADSDGRDG